MCKFYLVTVQYANLKAMYVYDVFIELAMRQPNLHISQNEKWNKYTLYLICTLAQCRLKKKAYCDEVGGHQEKGIFTTTKQ